LFARVPPEVLQQYEAGGGETASAQPDSATVSQAPSTSAPATLCPQVLSRDAATKDGKSGQKNGKLISLSRMVAY